ncbi:MAG: translation initiation factor IF-3 [Planctomycetota bacterium]
MARRRYFRPQDNFVRGPRINGQIRKSPVRLIDENDEMVGVTETPEAIRLAQEAGLDLVEVSADADPPVCRIMDYGKWKYEQSKKDRANKAKSKQLELKEVRLGRSMKIDPHDVMIRLNQARRFLMDGHKVQFVQNFRGREMVHRERGSQRMREIIETLSDISKLETPPRQMGRRMTMIMAPDKPKIEQIKRREAAAAAKAEQEKSPAPIEEPPPPAAESIPETDSTPPTETPAEAV